ncbi:MAG: 2-C-methyl-D-erythritol 4-phosphate cytidylyltransferase [Prevotella sp.]|jgi:2-C-methyl-D-erythritol 4-phosphate cytidylyltransferase|nr:MULTISPECIES: IspD/TarI family cytidylyltransferase [unclassified Prevotella]MCH3969967.1 2-C-methyl-D-erythritol 4-phosphate cytidylyltransferase [Prevotella sp.]MCH3984666.1 2-C-methyl-D-erythritol 4-phosphate cytidylyltransferase [Prevotella sp.]MCH3991273.1 2-C-methyl-D-erythritol 4-phosphate cytidylyltransferase [Prevotella sp.]MCH4018446.1 2-C-methyl-D-erythritol 4-phosphate cytidylyltransferase [Prevotella sp.]MCH4100457.1 2-C-methyl-D-erythritol 4-phosphate cytidylyltransferase [Pre
MNIAVIFAGGSGVRMHTKSRPKQFLDLNGKPIIIYTLELFDNHPLIDAIVVACIEEWIPFLKKQLRKFEITKVAKIVPGGSTGQDSIYNGLKAAQEISESADDIVLIHDGVRPLITEETITDNINKVKACGSCITCIPATETFIVRQKDNLLEIPKRSDSLIARAPQSFYLKDILGAHQRARSEGHHDFIDSCTMMSSYGYKLGTIIGPMENIKITTPTDYFVLRAMIKVHEDQQIFGIL